MITEGVVLVQCRKGGRDGPEQGANSLVAEAVSHGEMQSIAGVEERTDDAQAF